MKIYTSYNAALQQVVLSSSDSVNGVVTIASGSRIQSLAGAILEPYTANIAVSPNAASYRVELAVTPPSFLLSTVPGNQESMAVDAPIIVYFKQEMPRSLTGSALQFSVGSEIVRGTIEWTPDSRALTFYPASPLAPDAPGAITLSQVPWGFATAESVFFRTAARATASGPVRTNLIGTFPFIPTDGVIDLEFDSDQAGDLVRSARAVATSVAVNGVDIPMQVSV